MIQRLLSAPVISVEEMMRKLHPKMPHVVVGSFNRMSEVMQKLGYNKIGEN
jgi:predicted kinase